MAQNMSVDEQRLVDITTKVLGGANASLDQQIGKQKQIAGALKNTTKSIQDQTDHWVRNYRNVNKNSLSLSVLRSKMLIASFAIGTTTRFISKFIDASRDQEIAVARVTSAIQTQGFTSGVTTKQAEELASQLQKTTGVTDELTLESSALLLSFKNIGSDVFPQAQKAVLDMTSALNGGRITTETLKTQSIQLAKALDDPIKGLASLSRTGTTFDNNTKKQIKTLAEQGKIFEAQTLLLNEINAQYGDTASIDSYERSQRALQSAIGDLSEEVGFIFLPLMKEMTDSLTKFISSLSSADVARGLAGISAGATAFGLMSINLKKVATSIIVIRKGIQELGILAVFTTGKIGLIVKSLIAVGSALGVNKLLEYFDVWSDINKQTDLAKQRLEELETAQSEFSRVLEKTNELQRIALSTEIAHQKVAHIALRIAIEKDRRTFNFDKERLKRLNEMDHRLVDEIDKLDKLNNQLKNYNEVTKGQEASDFYTKLKAKIEESLFSTKSLFLDTSAMNERMIEFGLTQEQLKIRDIQLTEEQENTLTDLIAKLAEYDEMIKLQEDYQKQREQDNKDFARQFEEQQNAIATIEQQNHDLRMQFLSEFSDGVFNFIEQRRAKELELSLSSISNERNRINQSMLGEEQKQKKLEALDKKEEALRKKSHNQSIDLQTMQLIASQAMAIAEIYMKAQVAKLTASAQLGGLAPPVIAMIQSQMMTAIGMAVASGAVGVAGLQAQKFQYGGLVGGNLHSGGGTIIEAERGEYVMSRNAVQNFGLANMEAINNGSASPVNITFNNPVMSEDYTEDVIIPQIKKAVQRGADIGIS
tara:strand:+ start:18351 stop:20807 length:2457 start_codon:yes stop_codon:yes gene_type:complete